MVQNFEYLVVYLTACGKRTGLYKGMNKYELDALLERLIKDGCTVEKVEIVRKVGL